MSNPKGMNRLDGRSWSYKRYEFVQPDLPDQLCKLAGRLKHRQDSEVLRRAAQELEDSRKTIEGLERELAVFKEGLANAEPRDWIFRRLWA